MLSAIMKPGRKNGPDGTSKRRIEVIDVTAPAPGSSTFLPFLHVPEERRERARDVRPSDQRTPTFERDLQRVLDIFAN